LQPGGRIEIVPAPDLVDRDVEGIGDLAERVADEDAVEDPAATGPSCGFL
jgi:hypothetical protein